tara:strand:- start:1089 stop:1283 length:195 start_codon:yes stop_codon:yes gene_type:complete
MKDPKKIILGGNMIEINTEKFCINKIGINKYYNKIFDYTGSLRQCKQFAFKKGFGGGVEILKSI